MGAAKINERTRQVKHTWAQERLSFNRLFANAMLRRVFYSVASSHRVRLPLPLKCSHNINVFKSKSIKHMPRRPVEDAGLQA